MKKTVCLDFDGVLNTYTGWKGEDELFLPRPGLEAFLQSLRDGGYHIVVHSTRSAEKIAEWLSGHGIANLVDSVTDVKPPAIAYIDDRAIRFDGDYSSAFQQLEDFRAYWEPPFARSEAV